MDKALIAEIFGQVGALRDSQPTLCCPHLWAVYSYDTLMHIVFPSKALGFRIQFFWLDTHQQQPESWAINHCNHCQTLTLWSSGKLTSTLKITNF